MGPGLAGHWAPDSGPCGTAPARLPPGPEGRQLTPAGPLQASRSLRNLMASRPRGRGIGRGVSCGRGGKEPEHRRLAEPSASKKPRQPDSNLTLSRAGFAHKFFATPPRLQPKRERCRAQLLASEGYGDQCPICASILRLFCNITATRPLQVLLGEGVVQKPPFPYTTATRYSQSAPITKALSSSFNPAPASR